MVCSLHIVVFFGGLDTPRSMTLVGYEVGYRILFREQQEKRLFG
jgi:hypothetical protein